jgi:hypothetical protein
MLKKFIVTAACFVVYMIFSEGCVYHKGDDYPPSTGGGGNCNDSNVRYSVEIKAILDANCRSCHNSPTSESGINLYDYSTIHALATDGQFTYGTLLSAVLQKGGAPFMPKSEPQLQLDDCDLNKIAAWVYSGAPDN